MLFPYFAFILHPYFSEATDQNGALPSPQAKCNKQAGVI